MSEDKPRVNLVQGPVKQHVNFIPCQANHNQKSHPQICFSDQLVLKFNSSLFTSPYPVSIWHAGGSLVCDWLTGGH